MSITYSVYIDNKQPAKLDSVLPRQIHSWIKDDNVIQCYECSTLFTFFKRKHHCRGCGRIFCYYCSNKFVNGIIDTKTNLIDKDAFQKHWLLTHGNTELPLQRVCSICYNIFAKIKKLSLLIQVFELLTLNITDYKTIMFVSHDWNDACLLYLSKFREIQYNLSNHKYTIFEQKCLYNNFDIMIGHSKLIIQFIKSVNWTNMNASAFINRLKGQKKVSCWKLMCGRHCQSFFDAGDVIDILLHVSDIQIRIYFIQYLTNMQELLTLIPILTYAIRFDKENEVSEFMIRKSLINFEFCNKYYWELFVQLKEQQYNSIYQKAMADFKNILSKEANILEQITQSSQIVDICSIISNNSEDIILQNVPLPLNPNVKIKKICIKDIEIKKSKTQPYIVPLIDTKNNMHKFIYKKEDIRKDNIILSIIKMMDIILKKSGLDMGIIVYNVLPTSLNAGIIEYVENAETIYNIQKMKYTIQNYIMENNPKLTIDNMKKKFLKSVAGYCVITYLLGIGDRHLDNIMVTSDGKLFHIDYGYVMGLDPKPLSPHMRITPEMVDALGGIKSKYYIEFEKLCTLCYNCLRRHHNLFMNMMVLLTTFDKNIFTINDLEREIINRFLPGENMSQAEVHLISQLHKSQSAYSWVDYFHFQKQDGTLTKYADYMYQSSSSILQMVWK